MSHKFPLFLIPLFIAIFVFPAHGVVKIDITKGNINPIAIAIPVFSAESENAMKFSAKITQVIIDNLQNSGLFKSIDKRAFIEQINGVEEVPSFSDWRKINAQSLVVGTVTENAQGDLKIKFRLWDVLSGKQFTGKSFNSPIENWRRVAHLISDEIYTRLTGEGAYFDSRIIYVAETGHWKKKIKRLAIMDQDGANVKYLTSGRVMVLTPRFDPSSQRIIYLAYYGNKPSVYLYDLQSGKEDLIGRFKGMSFAPRFSPDGKYAIMSVSGNGNSDLYELDLSSRDKKQLTKSKSIDTSPSYAPDGKRIVFNSDRGGSQQIYTMDRDGDNVERISFGKGIYATPVWSPRGDLIAFTKMRKGKFHIGVMRPDGSGERLLTQSYLDEAPTWSPNGRVIMFWRKTPNYRGLPGMASLHSVDLTGYNERKIKTPTEASDPAWSPLLSR